MPPNLETFEERQRYAEALVQVFEKRNADLARLRQEGKISQLDFMTTMRENIKEQNGMMLVVGAGGNKSEVDSKDWLRLGPQIREQERYLERFGRDIEAGRVHSYEGRASMYARSSLESFWDQALPVKFPATPGDGTTPCLTNCGCEWSDIHYERDMKGKIIAVLARWVLRAKNNCDVCKNRAIQWNPIRLPVKRGFRASSLFKAVA